jgi:uncharacterized protein (UPF0276 family)
MVYTHKDMSVRRIHLSGEVNEKQAKSSMDEHFLGFGLGLRTDHFQQILDSPPNVDWFEITFENFL